MIPVRTPFFLPLVYPSLVWRVPTREKVMYLTFDDGPVRGPTDFVLETLKRLGSSATFFCIGDNIRKHPDIFDAVVAGGHVAGNHTFNHLNGWNTPFDQYLNNVELCRQEIEQRCPTLSDKKMFFRPPYGKISFRAIRALRNYNIIMWDVLTRDFDASLSEELCLRRSISSARSGSVIIFHDSYKAERNLQYVLPRFMEHFLEKGFLFKPLPQ